MTENGWALKGRSPLTRGRLPTSFSPVAFSRSIPAHAGETWRARCWRLSPGVDPRSRGGDTSWPCASRMASGRSPLTRGRRASDGSRPDHTGSIPAHAGETPRVLQAAGEPEVDPRSRGGDICHRGRADATRGRSPLTRGRPGFRQVHDRGTGSIPAHAGETWPSRSGFGACRVDPRSRGGDHERRAGLRQVRGRSPLTRGRRAPNAPAYQNVGSIPAHAGETGAMPVRMPATGVDPRSRGGDSRS